VKRGAIGARLITGCCVIASLTGCLHAVAQLSVTGPISGGLHGRPFTTSHVTLAPYGYLEEEYVLAGSALTHVPRAGSELAPNGVWDITTGESQPYRTRLLVRRPSDPARFNGTLVVEWLNVSGGVDIDADWVQTYAEILRGGYAWVGVSAQRAAVNGMQPTEIMPVVPPPLTKWDPERYADLVIPDDALSYDIFSQAGRLLASKTRAAPDPLGGLVVDRVVAMGASQSAHRLATYVNAAHPLVGVYDGYLIHVRFGRGASLATDLPTPSPLELRSDLDVPVLAVNTESEAIAHLGARRKDSELFRYWEIAGASHQDAYVTSVIAEQFRRDLQFEMSACDLPINTLPARYVMNAALRALDEWIRNGSAPASAPRLAISGSPPKIERDEYGNARGGLRLPQLAVPVARYGPDNAPGACRLNGATIPFDRDTLEELYSDRQSYLSRYETATRSAIDQGFLLAEDLDAVLSEARRVDLPDRG
jgi:hypothetical protein